MKVSCKMDSRWIAHFKPKGEEAKQKMKDSVYSSKHILDAAVEILKIQQAGMERPKLDDYDCPSWSHKQAHINGEIAGLNKAISLLTIKDRTNV